MQLTSFYTLMAGMEKVGFEKLTEKRRWRREYVFEVFFRSQIQYDIIYTAKIKDEIIPKSFEEAR